MIAPRAGLHGRRGGGAGDSAGGCGGDCTTWQQMLESRFDGDPARAIDVELDEHVTRCPACRSYARDLEVIRETLRDLPTPALPEDALETVWAATVDADAVRPAQRTQRASTPRAGRSNRRIRRVGLAAAALLAVTAGVAWIMTDRSERYTEAELVQIEHDLQLALVTLGQTLRSAEQIAVEDVLVGEAAPALRHIPLGPSLTTNRE